MNRFGIVYKAVRDSVKVATWNYDILDSVANSVWSSVWRSVEGSGRDSIGSSVQTSVEHSAREYFQMNSDIIKQ